MYQGTSHASAAVCLAAAPGLRPAAAPGLVGTMRLPVRTLNPHEVHRTAPGGMAVPQEGQAVPAPAGVGSAAALVRSDKAGGGGGAALETGGWPGTTRAP